MTRSVAEPYFATLHPTFEAASEAWDRLASEGDALPFQRRPWLAAWSGTIGRRTDLDLLAVTLHDRSGVPVAGLPLVRERRRLRRIGFADGGFADYNGPILGRDAPGERDGAIALWRALKAVLPAADAVRFERMPLHIGQQRNPFALLPGARPSPALGFDLRIDDGFERWRTTRPRRYRMELGRCARLFDALPGARFAPVASSERMEVLGRLEVLQRSRFAERAQPYALDAPEAHDFHHALAAAPEPVALFALWAEGAIVAVLFGVRAGASFTMLRVAADAAYARLSPARLVIVRAMEHLAEDGVRRIDFGLGDYPYKRRLGAEPIALVDVVASRSLPGLLESLDHRGRAALRGTAGLAAMRRLRERFRLASARQEHHRA